ncbi:MAG: helix-turn-helix domain-containing protein [Clostridia bacterium]
MGDRMGVKEAVVLRFQELCRLREIRLNELATRSGVTPSTVYSMVSNRRHDITMVTIKKLCDGLDISLSEFFDSPLFKNLEQEIQ